MQPPRQLALGGAGRTDQQRVFARQRHQQRQAHRRRRSTSPCASTSTRPRSRVRNVCRGASIVVSSRNECTAPGIAGAGRGSNAAAAPAGGDSGHRRAQPLHDIERSEPATFVLERFVPRSASLPPAAIAWRSSAVPEGGSELQRVLRRGVGHRARQRGKDVRHLGVDRAQRRRHAQPGRPVEAPAPLPCPQLQPAGAVELRMGELANRR